MTAVQASMLTSGLGLLHRAQFSSRLCVIAVHPNKTAISLRMASGFPCMRASPEMQGNSNYVLARWEVQPDSADRAPTIQQVAYETHPIFPPIASPMRRTT